MDHVNVVRVLERRSDLGGGLPQRRVEVKPQACETDAMFQDLFDGAP